MNKTIMIRRVLMATMLPIIFIATIAATTYAKSSITPKVEDPNKTALYARTWENFLKTKDYKLLETVGLPEKLAAINNWERGKGVILLKEDGDPKNNNIENKFEANRWFAVGRGPRGEVWKEGETYKPYYFETLYRLIQIAETPDYKRSEFTRGFDYNRVVEVAGAQKATEWKNKDMLKNIEIVFQSPEIEKALNGHTYVLSGGPSSQNADEPALELNGVFYTLTPKYFENDWAYRMAGYESMMYGPEGAFIDQFVDASLNLLLFKAKFDVAKMYDALATYYSERDKKKSKEYKEKSDLYTTEANEQKNMILKYLWSSEKGMFFDFDAYTHTLWSFYPTAGGAYALWSGIFDVSKPEEVDMLLRCVDYVSQNLHGPKGFYASGVETGLSWDKPNVYAIQQQLVTDGLKSYATKLAAKGLVPDSKKLLDLAR